MFGAKPTGGGLPANMAAPKTGPEMMLEKMGLGDVMAAARQLASSGSIEKILAFSEGLNTLNENLSKIAAGQLAIVDGQREILAALAAAADAGGIRRSDAEPGSDTGDAGSPVRTSRRKAAPSKDGPD